MAGSSVSMKLLIDTSGKRVLFAEAGKDCVDFLFYILSLPVATVVGLLREEGMKGSLPNLYKSLEDLSVNYIEPDKKKNTYLKPAAPVSSSSVKLLALEDASSKKTTYRCPYCQFSSLKPGHCRECDERMVSTVEEASESGGLVKGLVTYMVMDDLKVKPMSTISSITLLNDFNVKDVSALKEKVVNVGMKEAIKLLKISLQSENVLTELFC